MKTKRILLLTLSLMLSLGTLIACGNEEITGDQADTDSEWPGNEPIQMVVPYSSGGATDRDARLIQPFLQEELGTSVVIKNQPGAGTQLGSTEVYNAEADGMTILATNYPDLNMTIANDAPYGVEDFVPIAVELKDPRIIMVPKDSPFDTLSDFIDAAIENPGSISVSVTQGGAQDLLGQWLKDQLKDLGADFRITGYDSGGDAATAMSSGHVDATIGDDLARYNLRDEAKVLAIASEAPSDRWPEGKTLESQLKEYDIEMPAPDFLARYKIYAVKKEVKEDYPERFEILQQAFLKAAENSDYLAKVEELEMADLMIWEKGENYEDMFKEQYDPIKKIVDSVK